MKLLTYEKAPNPRRVHMFLAEKGVDIPTETIDLGTGEHKAAHNRARIPDQALPVLELDDGRCLTESVAICRYIEALHPEPPLFGTQAWQQAEIEMWNRRAELTLGYQVRSVFRHLHPGMAGFEVPQVPEWGEANKEKVSASLNYFNDALQGRPYLAGEAFSIADITLFVALELMKPARLQRPAELAALNDWYEKVAARPSNRR